jgi:peptidyl-prolyl cis-trans isomerase D
VLQSMRSAAKYIWIVLIVTFIGGFLLYETSGLVGRAPVTTTTTVATVDGEEILYTAWQNAVATLEQQQQQRLGRAITLDERRTLEDQAFDELVNEVLLRREYRRRGIAVSDEEIVQAARLAPPPQAMQSPDLQTDGRFDLQKYQRLLASPVARQSGMLVGLEQYYRTEIPKQKLFDQVASGAYLSDERLWQVYRDRHDSAEVSAVVLRPELLTDTAVSVPDGELSAFYARNKKLFERPGRAVVSLLFVPRTVTAGDSAAARAKIDGLRAEIAGGTAFDAVARRASDDSVSGANGGALGKGARGRFTPQFEEAAYALKVGELSQPVLTSFGWHLIRVESKAGDTLDVRHLLVAIGQSDSSAVRTDRRADSLATRAANQTEASAFDAGAAALGLTPAQAVAFDKEPMTFAGRYVPSVSAWAFSGVRPGESSDLFDSPEAYFVARLDSLVAGGVAPLADVKDEIRRRLARDKRLAKLRPLAEQLVATARGGSLEAAATQRNLTVERSRRFVRVDAVPGLGQFTEAVGAAFSAPVGQVAGPFRGADALVVFRVESRTEASKATFEAGKAAQRAELLQSLRQQKVEEFLANLREKASIKDRRAEVNAALRRQSDL